MPRWSFLILSSLLVAAGTILRLVNFGRFGFWNDEAWVALATRVETLPQFWLAAGPTPIGFALLLRAIPSSVLPEIGLRAVPLGFGCATMWFAWRLGRRVAGPAGALAALAVVALDPMEIAYSKELKQYTAEAACALAALDALQAFAVGPSRVTLRRLAVWLCVGVLVSNAQIFVAGPVIAVAVAVAVARGDHDVRRAGLPMLAVTLGWFTAWYAAVVAPHITSHLSAYFVNEFVPVGSVSQAARFVWTVLEMHLAYMLGRGGWLVAACLLAMASVVRPSVRPVALAVVLLLLELIGLGMARRVPFGAARVMLFCYSALGTTLAVGAACTLSALASGTARRVMAFGLGAMLVADAAVWRDWTRIGNPPLVEDVGPLIRSVEAERDPADVLLLYGRTLFVYGYYQRRLPVLVAAASTTGAVPLLTDPRVRLVDRTTIVAESDRAFADGRVVWFVGSRMGKDGSALEQILAQRGVLTRREVRTDATLLRFEGRTSIP